MSDLENWAKSVDLGIQAQREVEANRSAEFVTRRQLIDGHAPELWEQLVEAFKSCCKAFNDRKGKEAFVFSLLGVHTFLIRPDGGVEALAGTYFPSTKTVRIQSEYCNLSETYTPTVIASGDGTVVFSTSAGQRESCANIAKNSLEPFIKVCLIGRS
jgi:hypothetical protein